MAKPFIKWAGGKTQLLAQFELLIPQDLNNTDGFTYIEPFVGGGAMLFYMLQKFPNMSRAIINDINPNLTTAYRIVRDSPSSLVMELKRLQGEFRQLNEEGSKKEYFLNIRKSYNTEEHDDITKTAMFIFLNRTCFNGLHRVNSKGHFNVPFGKYANPTICDENLIMEDSSLLQNVEIFCGRYSLGMRATPSQGKPPVIAVHKTRSNRLSKMIRFKRNFLLRWTRLPSFWAT